MYTVFSIVTDTYTLLVTLYYVMKSSRLGLIVGSMRGYYIM
ncbi:hypothetical protein VPHK460_0164 [Vibrio phage K460]